MFSEQLPESRMEAGIVPGSRWNVGGSQKSREAGAGL